MLSGKIAQASPSIADYTQGINGSSTPKDLETALQLNYLAFTAPNMTPDALELFKRRLRRAAESRPESARRVRRESRGGQHLATTTAPRPLKPEDVAKLEPRHDALVL